MKKIFIKYNPYNLTTEIKVDDKNLLPNSKIREKALPGSRLQEWIEDLPQDLIDEYNDNDFYIDFHGTLMDYEDLTEVFTAAYNQGKLTATLNRIPAKETADKEKLIDQVFQEIQNGPFDELREADIINSFEHAKSSEFEVCVVATMSAGKSTLINSMLGTKLMPSKQEACTAIITKIKDTDGKGNWDAEVYDSSGSLLETHNNLTYEIMDRLNGDKNVSTIKINGDIPFVSSEEISLVLIDTPGPNNARDPEHFKTQNKFLSNSSKSLVIYIMEGTFGSSDDNKLLKRVAKSMMVGGKQSKDRFIFVINKMDDRRKEDGATVQTLDRVKAYLEKHGITNPNIFPAAALPALNIRLIQNDIPVDEDTKEETEMKIRKINRNEELHFEKFTFLPASIRGNIKQRLSKAVKSGNKEEEALIHSGIISIEAAISQYVQKYAKTAKIKNIVDTFIHKLDNLKFEVTLQNELAKNKDDRDIIAQKIATVRKKIDDVKTVKKFNESVDDAVINVCDEAESVITDIITSYQSKLRERIDSIRGEEIKIEDVDIEVEKLYRFANKLEPEFRTDLDELIRSKLIKTSKDLLDKYREKIKSLTDEIDTSSLFGISFEPIKLISASIYDVDSFSVKKLIKKKEVEDGTEWVANTDKKWYKPWTWFQKSGYYVTKYKKVKYINAEELAEEFFVPIQDSLMENSDNAKKYTIKQSNHIAKIFSNEFKSLDNILKEKLIQLESYASDSEKAEQRIFETEKKIEWIENIKNKVNSILEI